MTPLFVAIIIASQGGHIVDETIVGSAPSQAVCDKALAQLVLTAKIPKGVVLVSKCVQVDLPYEPKAAQLNDGIDKPLAPGQGSTDGMAKLPQVTDL